jgi:superfamily II DNA or RNA helicase
MAKPKKRSSKQHPFRNKLILNQWIISLFGINSLRAEFQEHPFRQLSKTLQNCPEGTDADNIHLFYHALVNSNLLGQYAKINREQIFVYEENIVRHTQKINEKRERSIRWKYHQWLTLLFVEIYLDRFFGNRERLLEDLNDYIGCFNRYWSEYADIESYEIDDLNKICLQNATGSGKTLLMHVNLLQYVHYAQLHGKEKEISRIILLTPNERLSEQHNNELEQSGITSQIYSQDLTLFNQLSGLNRVDILEVTKLADKNGVKTIATRNLGDQNLLFVDEGHRGMSSQDEGVWFRRRSDLCVKGFTFEYSATFEQAVRSAKNDQFENTYAKTILFDYSYRWFYEDGFGKDYRILNFPDMSKRQQQTPSLAESESLWTYLIACLLKYYQQLKIYKDKLYEISDFNIEKPMWVFVGNTVSKSDERATASDVALIIQFIADFLSQQKKAVATIQTILRKDGQNTGMLDNNGNDIFAQSFNYLAQNDTSFTELYRDILKQLFNSDMNGILVLNRVKGDYGEISLRVGASGSPFGLINIGDTKGFCDHIINVVQSNDTQLRVEESDFTETIFESIKDSTSSINLLIGSRKFIEGWDCWRVSTLGLMHVGRSEGTQIIQLFGRGVRLKGYKWSLKRSGHSNVLFSCPPFIEEIETLNIFGIKSNYMEEFHQFLIQEGLPGNERRETIQIPLNVTFDFGKKLKILKPKRKKSDGKEYDFKIDAPVPIFGQIPQYLKKHPIVSDWYPRIMSRQSKKNTEIEGNKDSSVLRKEHLELLDYDVLYFELEHFKREHSWHNFNISRNEIRQLLSQECWYKLLLPKSRLEPSNFEGIRLIQQIASELLKRYAEHYYNYCKREFIEPRLELCDLNSTDELIPQDKFYNIIVDGNEQQIIASIKQLKKELAEKKETLSSLTNFKACVFDRHLYQPLFQIRKCGKITVLPVSLNESEFQFVVDLKKYCNENKLAFKKSGTEIFLLRNLSRGKGIGFFEVGNFHPDFILWMFANKKQYITFIEPHGLLHEGVGSEKLLFYQRIKNVEKRLHDPEIVLNGIILSWTNYNKLQWGLSKDNFLSKHVLFMDDAQYTKLLFEKISAEF